MKKAIFFSIVSILIIILFVTSFSLVSEFKKGQSEIEVTRTEVRLLNSVVQEIETNYLEKMVYVTSKNTLVGLSKYYEAGGQKYYNLEDALDEAMQAGIYRKVNLTPKYIDYNYTVEGLSEKLVVELEKVGIIVKKLNITIPQHGVEQVDPWTIQVTAKVDYHFTDRVDKISWKGYSTKYVNVSVIGIYAFDYEDGHKTNYGVITDKWVEDEGPYYTEYSVVDKLTLTNTGKNKGICSPDFKIGDHTCKNDTSADH